MYIFLNTQKKIKILIKIVFKKNFSKQVMKGKVESILIYMYFNLFLFKNFFFLFIFIYLYVDKFDR